MTLPSFSISSPKRGSAVKRLERVSHSTVALLAFLLVGGVVGAYAPEVGLPAELIGRIYLAVVNMVAIPLLVVATFFGLRQTMRLPRPATRASMIAALALVLVVGGAASGVGLGLLGSPGSDLSGEEKALLGTVVHAAGARGDDVDIDLMAAPVQHAGAGAGAAHESAGRWVPSNFFRELADGRTLGILSCAILFGLAFALARPQSPALDHLLEPIYRALELIIARVNLLLPLLAFSVAASLMAQTDAAMLRAMSGFLACFGIGAALLSAAALSVVVRRSGLTWLQTLRALKAPMLVSMASASSTASIPHTIAAMSERLGFSRGVVELVVPTSAVFLRAGTALYMAVLVMFVANLYDRVLGPADLLLVCVGATLAAFASAGYNGAASVAIAGMVLSLLQLPVESALALFVAIDLLCEGPRNLLTLLAACMLIAVVSAGLPSERVAASGVEQPPQPLQFSFSRPLLVLALACGAAAAAAIVALGVAVGMRKAEQAAAAMTKQQQNQQIQRARSPEENT